jgi:ubiquinol-cytochrome c reductase iron-sulfur subunit
MSVWRWIVALVVLGLRRVLRRGRGHEPAAEQAAAEQETARAGTTHVEEPFAPQAGRGGKAVAPDAGSRRAELVVALVLVLAALAAAGFAVTYGVFDVATLPNELLGGCIALALGLLALALAISAHRLVPNEEMLEDYPEEHPEKQREVAEIIEHGGSLITRKQLLVGAGSLAGGALGVAALTPALSLGPLWYTAPLFRAPWRAGKRLVDEHGAPLVAALIEEGSFYTAFPEGADREEIGSPVVVVRVPPAKLRLPAGREGWAPYGILAFSKICTHAGCAVALYRKPTFRALEPEPALVCPCHYSTFNPATGASVIFGPAGRPLPQLPLTIDAAGHLRAAGNFSGPVGPAWWGVRLGGAK